MVTERKAGNVLYTISAGQRPWIHRDLLGDHTEQAFLSVGTDGATNAYNHVVLSGSEISAGKLLTGFSFDDLPGGSTVDGVEFVLSCPALPHIPREAFIFTSIRLRLGGTFIGDNLAPANPFPVTYALWTIGGPTELWNTGGLSRADVSGSDFGVHVQVGISPSYVGDTSGGIMAILDGLVGRVYHHK